VDSVAFTVVRSPSRVSTANNFLPQVKKRRAGSYMCYLVVRRGGGDEVATEELIMTMECHPRMVGAINQE